MISQIDCDVLFETKLCFSNCICDCVDTQFHFFFTLKRQVPLVEQVLLTLPGHLILTPLSFQWDLFSSSWVFSADHCLSLTPSCFSYSVVSPSSIYGFCLPVWNFQTLLTKGTVGKMWDNKAKQIHVWPKYIVLRLNNKLFLDLREFYLK